MGGRLARVLVQEREQFVRTLFGQSPGMTAAEANEKLKEKFKDAKGNGLPMRPVRIYELRKEIREFPAQAAPAEPVQPEVPSQPVGVALPLPS